MHYIYFFAVDNQIVSLGLRPPQYHHRLYARGEGKGDGVAHEAELEQRHLRAQAAIDHKRILTLDAELSATQNAAAVNASAALEKEALLSQRRFQTSEQFFRVLKN